MDFACDGSAALFYRIQASNAFLFIKKDDSLSASHPNIFFRTKKLHNNLILFPYPILLYFSRMNAIILKKTSENLEG